MSKTKNCTCQHYKHNEPHEYTCAMNINQRDKPQRTPGPWTVKPLELYEGGTGLEIVNRGGEVITDNQTYYPKPITEANAEFIVKACNNHDALVEALKEALAMLKIYYKPNSDGSTPTITKIEQALKQAEEA